MSKSTPSVPALSGEQSLNRYLSEIKKYPVLTAEQEYMLAKRYEEHEDPEAAAQLVSSHLRLVAKIAMGYRGYGLPVSDLISEGCMQNLCRIGLIGLDDVSLNCMNILQNSIRTTTA